jgi:3-oxoacyl-[acyl-carrier protein] reductase
MNIQDLRIIVTGGAAGMGLHFATRLHQAGAQVAVGDVDTVGLEALPEGIHRRRLDVANNAGILRDGLLVKKDRNTGEVTTLSAEKWQAVLAVNLTGATFMVREVVAHMARSGQRGVVVNLSSVARHGNRGQSNYVAAKAALAANTVTWAREFAPFGIRVCAVAPGMIDTPMTRGMNQKALDAFVAQIPVGRVGQPEDIWLAVKFCLECEYFDGRTIDVDGGAGF